MHELKEWENLTGSVHKPVKTPPKLESSDKKTRRPPPSRSARKPPSRPTRGDKPTVQQRGDKPTVQQRGDKPTVQQRGDKPTVQQRGDKPTVQQRGDPAANPKVAMVSLWSLFLLSTFAFSEEFGNGVGFMPKIHGHLYVCCWAVHDLV